MRKIENKHMQVEVYYCDRCGKEMSRYKKCELCGKHLCSDCSTYDDGEMGDYPDQYCKQCWKIGSPFRAKMCEIELDAENLTDEQHDLWKKAAKAANAKNGG